MDADVVEKLNKAKIRGTKAGAAIGSVLVGTWTVAAAAMLMSFGAWGWVVWPAAVVFWLSRTSRAVAAAKKQIAEIELERDFAPF